MLGTNFIQLEDFKVSKHFMLNMNCFHLRYGLKQQQSVHIVANLYIYCKQNCCCVIYKVHKQNPFLTLSFSDLSEFQCSSHSTHSHC